VVPVALSYVRGLFWNEAQDEVVSAGLIPEFFVDRAGGGDQTSRSRACVGVNAKAIDLDPLRHG
jgi:hypothetical protein